MKSACFLTLGLLPLVAAMPMDAADRWPMPRVEDYTHLWWAEGFPGHTPGALWRRIIQTGYYALVLDTDTLRIPHFGPVPAGVSYSAATRADNGVWQRLPPAELALSITADGKTYRCTEGGPWSQFKGPRLIESGRFLQRADVTDLVFAAEDGTRLNVEARFETVAWPDRLALILAARPGLRPIPAGEPCFQADGQALPNRPAEEWADAAMEIRLSTQQDILRQRWELPRGQTWSSPSWQEVFLAVHPTAYESAERTATNSSPDSEVISVSASEIPNAKPRPVDYDAARGWHRINLDGIEPIVPGEGGEKQNDAIERVRLVLSNPTDREQTARLLLEKNAGGFRQRIGQAITGMSAVLRDTDGHPIGVPVQLSKNWHGRAEGGVYAGLWFHGFTQLPLPPQASVEFELALVYGHWGGVAAASHAQLCLIGWGSNQLWNQSALGSWGESICYEPDQVQAQCSVLDVRPLMVRSMAADQPWNWTHNVGGGDFFRFFDAGGRRVPHGRMRTAYHRYGPCLTEVTYAGRIGEGIEHSATVSLARTDDLVRGTYQLRLDVTRPTEFSRFVLFQIGADTYSYTGERMMAVGNETGLANEWNTQWGGGAYKTTPVECTGRVPWISLHEAVSRAGQEAGARGRQQAAGAWANRGIVIRSWQARLGGKPAAPWIAEHGVTARGEDTSTADLLPPPDVARLEPGDFVQATIEHIIVPQFAADYYGPNEALRAALGRWENSWRMIHREAVGNDRRVEMMTGTLESLYPAVCIRATNDAAEFTLNGGLGYVPITFSGLTSPRDHMLLVDDQPVDQAVHGNDFWQIDYDPSSQRWSRTYNLPIRDDVPHTIRLKKSP